jgi:hypothetical protein
LTRPVSLRFQAVDHGHLVSHAVRLFRLQGIPIGITFGTLPFLLKPRLSYSQLALFSLSSWPYSLKLLWSPVVDAWFWNRSVFRFFTGTLPGELIGKYNRLGRRKSWIIPSQLILGLGMWFVGASIETWLNAVSATFLCLPTSSRNFSHCDRCHIGRSGCEISHCSVCYFYLLRGYSG